MAVQIAEHYTQRIFYWTAWKAQQLRRRGIYQFDESESAYLIWFYDGPEVHLATIWKGEVPPEQLACGYTQVQNDADKADFESDWKVDANKPLEAHEGDGRSVVAAYPAYMGTQTSFTGHGDDVVGGVPDAGPRLEFVFDGAGSPPWSRSVDVQFVQPIQLADGAAIFAGAWDVVDGMTFSIEIAANVVAPNATSTGNCNLVDTGAGYNVIVPAAGDGAYDIDLATAKPIIPDIDGGVYPWWVDLYTGAVSVSARGDGNAILLDVPQSVRFINDVPIGAADGHWDIEVYRAEYVHPSWVLRARVDKRSVGAGKLAGELLIYRIRPPGTI